MNEFRNLLAKILLENHWTQLHLATELHTDQATISRWVNGRVPMSTHHIGKLLSIVPENRRGALLEAFLRDQIPSGCGHLIAVNTTGDIAPEMVQTLPFQELSKDIPPDLRRQLIFASELAMNSPDVRKIAHLLYRIVCKALK
jgi:transcriptional regulator with XRE-family HTH domain